MNDSLIGYKHTTVVQARDGAHAFQGAQGVNISGSNISVVGRVTHNHIYNYLSERGYGNDEGIFSASTLDSALAGCDLTALIQNSYHKGSTLAY